MSDTRTNEILDVAESRIRRGGFDAVSFRDIADAVGIKSASVHYHFPHKADLGRAVVARYKDRFIEGLGDADDPKDTVRDRLSRLTGAYRAALKDDGSVCLCAVLGGVSRDLPEEVSQEVARYFEKLLTWTKIAMADLPSGQGLPPAQVISMLQGAMVMAVALGRPALLEEAEAAILASV